MADTSRKCGFVVRPVRALPFAFLALGLGGCSPSEPADTGEPPGALEAGLAQARIPAPLGIGTAGFSPLDAPSSESPFAEVFPATTRFHGHPSIRVTALSRGAGHELIFVRTDTVGVFQQLRRALVLELEARLGREMDDVLVIGGTHTHAGPGRVIDGAGFYDYVVDRFFPEFYEHLVDALADTVEAALADLAPARLGLATAETTEGHNDRRCEDGLEYENGRIPLVLVEREGVVEGVMMAYAVHGTVLDVSDLTLSRDVSGGIEHAVENRFETPVQVMTFNAWGADMSPANPEVEEGEGAEMPDGYDQMERVGAAVASAVSEVLDAGDTAITWYEEPTLEAETFRVPLGRDFLGYEGDTFDYDYGAVYCSSDSDCDPETVEEGLDEACFAFSEETPAPDRTEFTLGRLGDRWFVTFTGEPGTLLAEDLMEGMRAHEGVEDILFLGYTQDYLGYAIQEDDWWQGGYEASGTLWGPRQGDYLVEQTLDAFSGWLDGGWTATQPPPTEPFAEQDYEPYIAETALDFGSVLEEVPATATATDTVSFTVAGGDPWLGAPVAYLETGAGEPVTRGGGISVHSDDYGFWVDLAVEPTYEDEPHEGAETARVFAWTFNLPVAHAVEGGWPALEGEYRLRVELPAEDGSTTEVTSEAFTVE